MHSPPLPENDVLSQLPPARFYKRRRRHDSAPLHPLHWVPWREVAFTGLGALIAIVALALIFRSLL